MPNPSKVLVVTLIAIPALACGGGSGGPGADFCHEHAAAECKKIYACPDPNVTTTGTEAQCTAAFTQLCTTPPAAGAAGGVNCSAGQHVNTAARMSCLDSLATVSCADYNSGNYTNVCDQVCVTPMTGTGGVSGGGGSGPGGTGGTGGTGSVPSSPSVAAFCVNFNKVVCDRAYACFAPAERDTTFTNSFGTSVAECNTARNGVCDAVVLLCGVYDAVNGNACVANTVAVTCAAFKANQTPAECAAACPG